MPESKHHKKNRSHSQWRKARNKRRARNQEQNALEKRGMKQAMKLMQQQFEAEQRAKALLPPPEQVEQTLEESHKDKQS